MPRAQPSRLHQLKHSLPTSAVVRCRQVERENPSKHTAASLHCYQPMACCPGYILRTRRAHKLQGEVPVVCLRIGNDEVGHVRGGTHKHGIALEEGCVGWEGLSEVARGARQSLHQNRLPRIPVVQLSEVLKPRKGEAAFTQAATKVPFVTSVWKEK